MVSVATEKALVRRIAIKNRSGRDVFSIDNDGDFVIDGNVVPDAAIAAPDKFIQDDNVPEFIIRSATGTLLARLNPQWDITPPNHFEATWPTLYLKGCLIKEQDTLDPPEKSAIFKNSDGDVIAYISTQDQCEGTPQIPAGSLVLKGKAFIGANPDPEARRTELILWDDFEDQNFNDCPKAYSRKMYTSSCPQWDPVSGSGDWEVLSDSTWVLRNKGTYSGQHLADKIVISQEQVDLDVNIDFKYVVARPLEIAFRRTATESVYVKADPGNDVLDIVKWNGTTETSLTSPPLPQPPAFPFTSETWYEMHISAKGDYADVWYRERDGEQGHQWTKLTEAPCPGAQLTGDHLYFSLTVEHAQSDNGRWLFDNIILNTTSDCSEPELACSGCP